MVFGCILMALRSESKRKAVESQLADQLAKAQVRNAELERKRDELTVTNALLIEQATTDGLTSLANRRHFFEVLEGGVSVAARHGQSLSLVMLDVDAFKSFNDRFGHPAGDEVLRTVADILRSIVRESDIVARYGGEEFVALLPSTDRDLAVTVAERLREGIEQWSWNQRSITVSLGIATLRRETTGPQALVEQADRALYHSKRRGRNRTTHHDDLARTTARRAVRQS